MMYSNNAVATADATTRFVGAVSRAFDRIAVNAKDASNLHAVEAG